MSYHLDEEATFVALADFDFWHELRPLPPVSDNEFINHKFADARERMHGPQKWVANGEIGSYCNVSYIEYPAGLVNNEAGMKKAAISPLLRGLIGRIL